MSRDMAAEEARDLDRILSFTPVEQEAYKMVLMFLCAVGKILAMKGTGMIHWSADETHMYFETFAKELSLGAQNPLCVSDGSRVPAVELYLQDRDPLKADRIWMVQPYLHGSQAPWRVDDLPNKGEVLKAALVVCKEWLPGWKWERLEATLAA